MSTFWASHLLLSPTQMAQPACSPFQASRAIPRIRTVTHVRCRPQNSVQSNGNRSFTMSRPSHAAAGTTQMPRNIMKQMPSQQSMRSRLKTVGRQDIPDDLGLMPQTFIRPSYGTLPALFGGDWKKRLQIEWLWTKTRFQNFFGSVPAFNSLGSRSDYPSVQALLLSSLEPTQV